MVTTMKITSHKNNDNNFKVEATLTGGKLLTIRNALKMYCSHSSMAPDVLLEVERAIEAGGTSALKYALAISKANT